MNLCPSMSIFLRPEGRPGNRGKRSRKTLPATLVAVLLAVLSATAGAADRVYQDPEEFITSALQGKSQAKVLWLTGELQAELTRILGHAPPQLRQRYWTDGRKTVWILEEVGKEDLITAGFVVASGRMEQVRVLVYRESRGMEVRYPAFVEQFKGAILIPGNRLDRSIDGISGATLSVGAMERMARLALYFDQKSRQ